MKTINQKELQQINGGITIGGLIIYGYPKPICNPFYGCSGQPVTR